ncbi:MAG: ATP-binding protein, partial [Bacteroidaceae bacterium]|nr:ATP-binding protein [Bacteroidaceae bacterium]
SEPSVLLWQEDFHHQLGHKYTPQRATAEYIWNGYDAHAKEVRVNTICENTFDSIIKVIVKDDGDGIIHERQKPIHGEAKTQSILLKSTC